MTDSPAELDLGTALIYADELIRSAPRPPADCPALCDVPGCGVVTRNLLDGEAHMRAHASGEEFAAIMRDLDRTGDAWKRAGYPLDGPEAEAREAVFLRLRAWNAARAAR